MDGSGSGVFISDKGLILTNHHVVAANIALKVKAKVRFGNKIVVTELDQVKVTKIHPKYDIALLEVQPPPNGSFIPAPLILKTTPAPATGGRCYAIGNPGGVGGKTLDLTITEGIISAAARNVNDLDYLQISAQINPGNSGGPVCDENGKVIGIATWKMTETEGIGFAIPIQKLMLTDFIDPKTKKPDIELAKQAEEAAQKYFTLAMRTTGERREALLKARMEAYRVSLFAVPNSPIPYGNISIALQDLGDMETARKYAAAALRVAPNDPYACHIYGIVTLKGREGDKALTDKCIDIWFRGIANGKDARDVTRCANNIAIAMAIQKYSLACAYMVQWTEVIAKEGNLNPPNDLTKESRTNLWNELQTLLPAEQLDAVRQKKDNFSKAEFDTLVAGKPLVVKPSPGGAIATAKTPPSSPVAPAILPTTTPAIKPVVPKVLLPYTAAQMDIVVKALNAAFGPKQIPVPQDGLEFPLPDAPNKMLLAAGGWQVVMSFPTLLKLGVFSMASGKIEGFIDYTDTQMLFATGGQLLAIYQPSTDTLDTYDLTTLKKLHTKKLALNRKIWIIKMGSLNPSRIFTLLETKTEHTAYLSPGYISVPDFNFVELTPEIKDGENPVVNSHLITTPREADNGTMDESGSTCIVGHSGSTVQYTVRDGGTLDFQIVKHDPLVYGSLCLTQNGIYVIGDKAAIARRDGESSSNDTDNSPYSKIAEISYAPMIAPVAGYQAFIYPMDNKNLKGLRLRSLNLSGFGVLMDIPIGKISDTWRFMLPPTRMFASAASDRAVQIMPNEKKGILYKLGLKDGSAIGGIAQPGKHFERKLTVAPDSKVVMQSGPSGMKLDEKTNSLVWDVPADFKTGQMVQAVLLVTPASGAQQYVVEKVSVP